MQREERKAFFRNTLSSYFDTFHKSLATDAGEWVVKGFRDMAEAIDSDIPYRNLEQYWQWRQRAPKKES